ncbi:dTDP-glucose 4,6-dehydratase [Desulfurivibrio sp. D14AmB]|uniref:dTDP-glucose 4,6-dehydratase n=1 Tax=Desulfurivibrio sp. D14AmB TaxID=3374370 RepID=UPI00376F0125
MRKLLITGGAGFIGANFVHYWARQHPGDRLVVLDALTYAGNPANLEGLPAGADWRLVHGDICDQPLVEQLLAAEKIDTIVHFAAESHVDRSIAGPEAFVQTNIVGTHTLLLAAKKSWPEGGDFLFHHVSTDEVYGSLGPADPPFSETTPYAPNSPYAASKAASDHLVRSYHHTYGLPVTTSNCSNNYGPYQFPEKLIPLVLINALDGKPLPIYGDGGNIRDWLQVEDHCRGIELVMNKGRRGETYNIGGHNEVTNLEIVHLLCRTLDHHFSTDPALARRFPHCPAAQRQSCAELITFVKDRPGHDRRYAIDPTRAEKELGYTPAYSFEAGIEATVDWYLAHEPWWRAILDGSYAEWVSTNYRNRN